MSSIIPFLFIPAMTGIVAFVQTRNTSTRAGWIAWSIALVIAFAIIRPWYVATSHCEGAATFYVPFVGAFSAASGGWVGISRGRDRERTYWLLRIALESGLIALVPGAFFILLLWPCR